ncbi:MAG: small basic protein [Planctomycetes bacterium]|nr:small basic protein [Planctomycetota bacterium]
MSIHKSLVPPSKLRRHRNVLTRAERLEILKKEGRWTEDRSVFGLAKVRNIMMKAKPKKKEEAAAAEGVPAAGATPATGAAPATAQAKGAAAPAKGASPAAAPAKGAAAPAKGAKEEKKK